MKNKKKKTEEWQSLPQRDFSMWIGEWLVSSFALKFYTKNKCWPKEFRKDSVVVKGRTISLELR